MARSSVTPVMSISTGGATMPRRTLTMRSVPPPRSRASGCAARAASASLKVAGRKRLNSGSASIKEIPLDDSAHCCRPREGGDPYAVTSNGRATGDTSNARRLWVPAFAGTPKERLHAHPCTPIATAPLFLDRGEHAVRRHRQIVEAHAGRVRDSVGERRQEGGER